MENTTSRAAWRHPANLLLLVGMLLLAAIIVISIVRDRIVNPPQFQISVTGQGKITYEPDIANINLGIEVSKVAKAADALKQLNDQMNKVIAAMEKAGIAQGDIMTQDYTLVPQYDVVNEITKLSGYTANQSVIVKVRDIEQKTDAASQVIAAASQAGVNKVNGIIFEASDIKELKQQARLKAIADARSNASEIEKALGVELGQIVGWWENYVTPEAVYAYDLGKGGAGIGGGGNAVVPSGTRELTLEVNVSYKIE
ncbi:MAG: SIMPL domain-containing protein [Planctomycetes bacterium]|jgi:hypothetical protein|nr:SIMPL domain-containing protein [Planctomycetota bacterium]